MTINVDPLRPTLSLSDSGGPFDGSAYPASVTITAPGGGASPTASLGGTVPTLTYFVGIGTSGTSLGATPPASPGTYTVVASFAGSVDYAPIQSAPLTFAIALDKPTIGLSTSSGSTLYGQTVTLTVTVAVAGHTPGGTISFFDGTTALGASPLDGAGTAMLSVSSLAVGSHAITATYDGDGDDLGVQSSPVPCRSPRRAPRSC